MVIEKTEVKRNILWLSRHKPLPRQLQELRRLYGSIQLYQHDKPISSAEDAISLAKRYNADVVVPVLPLSMIARLAELGSELGFTLLWAEMKVVHVGASEPCDKYDASQDTVMLSKEMETGKTFYRHFRFQKFKRIKAVKLEIEDV